MDAAIIGRRTASWRAWPPDSFSFTTGNDSRDWTHKESAAFQKSYDGDRINGLDLLRHAALHARVLETIPERRRRGRIRLDEPLKGRFGDMPVVVLEVSVAGFLIAHEGRLAPGATHPLTLSWNEATMTLECVIVRSILYRLGRSLGETSVYHSGLRIFRYGAGDFDHLRALIADRIVRALEEMKANARGIPPLAAYMYQPGKGELYRRCELIDGAWRKTETIRAQQPPNGFTVSAEVDPYHVSLLCETWERTTLEGRRLTQLLAELSISRAEGIPTRRYEP